MLVHDDFIKWKLFLRYWHFVCERNSPVTSEFPSQRPVTQSFGVFFDLRLNKRLSKPSRRRWFGTPSRSLWRHRNGKRHKASQADSPWWSTVMQCVLGSAKTGHQCLHVLFNPLTNTYRKCIFHIPPETCCISLYWYVQYIIIVMGLLPDT